MRRYRWTVPAAVSIALLSVGKFVLNFDEKGIDQLAYLSDTTQKILVGVNVLAAFVQLLAAAHVNLPSFKRTRPERAVGVLSAYSTNPIVRFLQKAGAAENDKKTSALCLAAVLLSAMTAALTMGSEASPKQELPTVLLCAAYLTLTFFVTWAVGRGFAPYHSASLSASGDVTTGASEGSRGSQRSTTSLKSVGRLRHKVDRVSASGYSAPELPEVGGAIVVANPTQVVFTGTATAPSTTMADDSSAERPL